jgi:uncharacterized integral membrane protein
MKPRLIAILVVVVLALIILLQNTHVTAFRLLFWKTEMSLVVLVLLVLLIGLVLGFVAGRLTHRPKHGAEQARRDST